MINQTTHGEIEKHKDNDFFVITFHGEEKVLSRVVFGPILVPSLRPTPHDVFDSLFDGQQKSLMLFAVHN